MRNAPAVPTKRSFSQTPPVIHGDDQPPTAARSELLADKMKKSRRAASRTSPRRADAPITTTLHRKSSPSLGRTDSSSGSELKERSVRRATRCSTVPAPIGDQENTAESGRRKGTGDSTLVDKRASSRPREEKQLLGKYRRRSMEIKVQRAPLDELRKVLNVIDPPATARPRVGKTRSSPHLLREKLGNVKPVAVAPPRAPVEVHVRKGATINDNERITPKRGSTPSKYVFRNPKVGSPRPVKQAPAKLEQRQSSTRASVQPPTLLQTAHTLLRLEALAADLERAKRGEAWQPPRNPQD